MRGLGHRPGVRAWTLTGTYYAPATGNVAVCLGQADDGAYLDWSPAYDPSAAAGPTGAYVNRAEVTSAPTGWTSATWAVAAGRAYRFSLRMANRDDAVGRGAGRAAFRGLGLTTVGGGAATCDYANLHPERPANVTVNAAGTAPTVTITAATSEGDATFSYTVKGGPAPTTATITTVGGTGSVLLAKTPVGTTLSANSITQDPVAGWVMTTSACTNRTTGKTLTYPYDLVANDDIVCGFASRPPPVTSPCVTNPVRNPGFTDGLVAPWSAGSGWVVTGGRANVTRDNAVLATDWLAQTVYGVAPSSALLMDLRPADGGGGSGGNQATFEIVYAGTVYATLLTSQAADKFGGTATLSATNGATVTPATIPMGVARPVTVILPANVPRSGSCACGWASPAPATRTCPRPATTSGWTRSASSRRRSACANGRWTGPARSPSPAPTSTPTRVRPPTTGPSPSPRRDRAPRRSTRRSAHPAASCSCPSPAPT
ncbi:hypothetical protein ACFQX7_37640 [Luedemannella flava]